jgi:hypothetical protein
MVRRGKLERMKGNAGQWLVKLPPDGLARSDRFDDLGHDQDLTEMLAELREEVTELQKLLDDARRPWWRRWLSG